MYVYVAFLFSFIYFGVERLSGYSDTWPQLFVTSMFIPFLIGTLPKGVSFWTCWLDSNVRLLSHWALELFLGSFVVSFDQ